MKFRPGDYIATWQKNAADAAATSNTAETCFCRIPTGTKWKALEAYFTPDATLTANDTNYAILNLDSATNGGTRTNRGTINTKTTGTGNWAAFTSEVIDISSWSGHLNGGDILTFEMKKYGAGGVSVPMGVLSVHLRPTKLNKG